MAEDRAGAPRTLYDTVRRHQILVIIFDSNLTREANLSCRLRPPSAPAPSGVHHLSFVKTSQIQFRIPLCALAVVKRELENLFFAAPLTLFLNRGATI